MLFDGRNVKVGGETVGQVWMHSGTVFAEAGGEPLGAGYRSKYTAARAVLAAARSSRIHQLS